MVFVDRTQGLNQMKYSMWKQVSRYDYTYQCIYFSEKEDEVLTGSQADEVTAEAVYKQV